MTTPEPSEAHRARARELLKDYAAGFIDMSDDDKEAWCLRPGLVARIATFAATVEAETRAASGGGSPSVADASSLVLTWLEECVGPSAVVGPEDCDALCERIEAFVQARLAACAYHNRELVFCGTCLASRLKPWRDVLRTVHDAVYTQMTADEYHDAWMRARELLGLPQTEA